MSNFSLFSISSPGAEESMTWLEGQGGCSGEINKRAAVRYKMLAGKPY